MSIISFFWVKIVIDTCCKNTDPKQTDIYSGQINVIDSNNTALSLS